MEETHKEHIKITADNWDTLELEITSSLGRKLSLIVNREKFMAWANGGLIQDCFPKMDVVTRELLKSGIDPHSQKKIFNNEIKSTKTFTLEELKKMWDEFRDIPINLKEEIEVDFYDWKPGTYRLDIWHWFDEALPNGIKVDFNLP